MKPKKRVASEVPSEVPYVHGAGGAPRQAQVQREQGRVRFDARGCYATPGTRHTLAYMCIPYA